MRNFRDVFYRIMVGSRSRERAQLHLPPALQGQQQWVRSFVPTEQPDEVYADCCWQVAPVVRGNNVVPIKESPWNEDDR